jgi:hypothetical protein
LLLEVLEGRKWGELICQLRMLLPIVYECVYSLRQPKSNNEFHLECAVVVFVCLRESEWSVANFMRRGRPARRLS